MKGNFGFKVWQNRDTRTVDTQIHAFSSDNEDFKL